MGPRMTIYSNFSCVIFGVHTYIIYIMWKEQKTQIHIYFEENLSILFMQIEKKTQNILMTFLGKKYWFCMLKEPVSKKLFCRWNKWKNLQFNFYHQNLSLKDKFSISHQDMTPTFPLNLEKINYAATTNLSRVRQML